jgi:O-antigen ligase
MIAGNAIPLPRSRAGASTALPWRDGPFPLRDHALFRTLACLIGLTLPLLTLKTSYYGTPTDLSSRVAVADLVCIVTLALLILRGSPAPLPWSAGVYVFGLVVSLFPALVISKGPEAYAWTSASAIAMAFLFYVLGLSIGESRRVTAALLAGACAVTLAESVIVFHDYFFSSQWFPDPMEGRARGTFKANGQLGAYGFCAAGMLISLGRVPESRRLRTLCLVAGLLASTFVFTASRRTGMICVFVWAVAFAVLGVRFSHRRFYRIFISILAVAILSLAIGWGALSSSFAGKRLTEGLTRLNQSDGFIQTQHRNIIRTSDEWFPMGFGPGRGRLIDESDPEHHEIHNGLLAVLVEQGVLGFLGFVAMVAVPLLRRPLGRQSEERALRRLLYCSFLLICFVFMFHNTLYRDRTFLLFLGMATAIARQESLRPQPEPEGGS